MFRRAIERLGLVGVIKTDAHLQAQALSQAVGQEIHKVLGEQRELEVKFEELISQRAGLKSMANKSKLKENQEEVHSVAIDLRQKTRNLSRNLKENPNVADNMNKVASVRQEVVALMGGCIQELRAERYPRSLRERVAEDQSREVHIRETIEREREASAAVRDLRQQLMQERESHEEEIKSQGQILAELKELVKELSAATVIETAYTAKEVQAKNACVKRTEGEELARLGSEAEALRQRITMEQRVHAVSAEFLKKKQASMQEEVLNWMQKYETDTTSKDKELETVKLNHQRDLVKLKELEEKYREELAAKETREMEAVQAKEAEIRAERDGEILSRAATTLQSLWKGFKARSSTARKASGKKGKGKKK